jgi:outer membrane protein
VTAFLATLAALPSAVWAAPAAEPGTERPWKIGVALGYGQRENPLVQSEDIPILVDIDIAWYGKRWFFDNGDVGRTFVNGEHVTLNAVARINSDRVFFSKTNTEYVSIFSFAGTMPAQPIEIPDRDYALEAGVELLSDGEWGFLQASAHHDVSDRHDGYEVDLHFGHTFRQKRWFVEPSLGASYKSAKLNDYYWGVRPEESNIVLPAYTADAGWNTELRLATTYQLTRNWSFVVAAQVERLSDEAAASPLVAQRSVKSGFAGFNFRF